MSFITRPFAILRQYRRSYLAFNCLYYGLVVAGMIYVSTDPQFQTQLLHAMRQGLATGPFEGLVNAYRDGHLVLATVLTFITNLFAGTLIEITIPSLILPFVGLVMGVFRAALWGLALSPSDPSLRGAMIPHALTLVIEGQAYIVAMLAVYIQGKAFLHPAGVGLQSHWKSYMYGLRQTAWLYSLIVILLAVAACYEAFEVILLQPLFAA